MREYACAQVNYARWAISMISPSLANALRPAAADELAAVEARWRETLPALKTHAPRLFGERAI